MIRISVAVIIAILFSTSVCFGQANSGSVGAMGQAGTAAVISVALGGYLFLEGTEKFEAGGVTKEEGENTLTTAAAVGAGGNKAGEAKLIAEGKAEVWAGTKKMIMGGAMMGMGIMSGAQGLNQLAAAAGASKSEGQSGYNGIDLAGNDFERSLRLPDGRTVNSNQLRELLNKQTAELARRGIKLDDKGQMTMPDGTTANLKDLSNGNASNFAAATGLGPTEMKELADKLNGANAKIAAQFGANAKDIKLGFSSGGGSSGSGGNGEGVGGGSKFDFNSLFGGMKPKDRSAASFTGPAKIFRGQPIGVAQDNIFKMVSRRYQEKSKTNYFMVGN
jgi:hypothetical protein